MIRTNITPDAFIRRQDEDFIYLCKHPVCTYGTSLTAVNELAENAAGDSQHAETAAGGGDGSSGGNEKKGKKGKKGKK